jgi:Ni,Fe-hydrogenase I large subunit
MKNGIYDFHDDRHYPAPEEAVRETIEHAWYQEAPDVVHPYDRTTNPVQKNTRDFAGKYSWSTAVSHAQMGRPLGSLMVSSEGACAAVYNYSHIDLNAITGSRQGTAREQVP